MCLCLGAAPTSSPGRAVVRTETITRSVCLRCGIQVRLDHHAPHRARGACQAETRSAQPRSRKAASWVPRARRLKLDIPLRYRVNKTSTWYEGIIENISQSGVLVQRAATIALNALIEMVFEMPEEISGQKNSNVVCQGRVMRAKDAANAEEENRQHWRPPSSTTSSFTRRHSFSGRTQRNHSCVHVCATRGGRHCRQNAISHLHLHKNLKASKLL